MTVLVKNKGEEMMLFLRKYNKYIISSFSIGILVYFMMMSLNLVNDLDGIWHLSNFIAGDWEISLGRGLQRYADRARFGIVSDPFNTMLTLLLISTANAVILMKFEFNNIVFKGLFLTISVANPVICSALSYSYMSVNFGLAYFFSVLAFERIRITTEIRKAELLRAFFGAFFLGISMAFYQAYICLMAVLAVMYILKLLLEKKSTKNVLQYMGLYMGEIILGGG